MTNQNDHTDQIDINEQLEEAFAAKAELAAGDALREKAERVPELLREKALQDARERAETGLEAAIAQAAPEFERLAQEVPLLRKRMQNLIDEIPLLAEGIRGKQNQLMAAGALLREASEAYDRAFVGEKPRLGEADTGLPLAMQGGGTRFDEVLATAGATNPALDFMPAEVLPEWLRLLLRAHRAGIIYRPERGSANWRRNF